MAVNDFMLILYSMCIGKLIGSPSLATGEAQLMTMISYSYFILTLSQNVLKFQAKLNFVHL